MMKLVVLACALVAVMAEHPAVGKVVDLDSSNIGSVLNGEIPAVIEFYAPWCPHCKSFNPVYESVAADVGQDYIIARVDGEKNVALADDWNIQGSPTVKLLRKGLKSNDYAKAEEYEGSMKKEALEGWLKGNAKNAVGTQSHIQMGHLQPELEAIVALPGRCYRSERA